MGRRKEKVVLHVRNKKIKKKPTHVNLINRPYIIIIPPPPPPPPPSPKIINITEKINNKKKTHPFVWLL